jgi:uroporphyrinogen-III synthase
VGALTETVPALLRWSRLCVTRPAGEAEAWVQALVEAGWPALAVPLVDIVSPQDPIARGALDRVRRHWADEDALMFVSAAAVQHFFAAVPPISNPPTRTRFWAPGPGTARTLERVLRSLGVPATQIDSPPDHAQQFDSEHLWPVVADQVRSGFRLLVVRGASVGAVASGDPAGLAGQGRDWLIQRCRERGAVVEACVAYERHAPCWSLEQAAAASAGAAPGSLWIFSGSQAVHHLRAALPDHDWSQAAALCTHERIAATARAAGFGQILISRPTLSDVLLSLESAQAPS